MRFPVFGMSAVASLALASAAYAQADAVDEGNDRFDRNDFEGAIASYSRAIVLDPRFSVAYARRGRAWRKKGDLDKAIQDLDHAIGLNDRDFWSFRERGLIYLAKPDFEKAVADFDKAPSSAVATCAMPSR